MEEVRCPGCGAMIPLPEGKAPACPSCGRGVEVIDGGQGMWILGLRQMPPPPPPPPPHTDDPLVRTYGRWKGIGAFLGSAGFVACSFAGLDLWSAYLRGFVRLGADHYVLGGAGLLLILAGAILFLAGRAFQADRLRRLDREAGA